jgi:polyhydroxybutyrate depolymerase
MDRPAGLPALVVSALLVGCSVHVRGLEAPDATPGAGSPDTPLDGGTAPIVGLPDAGAGIGIGVPDAGTGPVTGDPDAGASAVLDRPYLVRVPAGYDPGQPTPLLVLLHGYTASGWLEDFYLQLSAIIDEEGFLLAAPDGTRDATGLRFWNATDACCNWYGKDVDDVAYLDAVIADMSARYHVDPARVFLFGHSNGGFMAYRYACDRAAKVAGVVSLAAATWLDPARCSPDEPVSVLHIHGTWDPLVLYGGGYLGFGHAGYPGALGTVAAWAQNDGCLPVVERRGRLDLEALLPGSETEVSGYAGCDGDSDVELWTIERGGHVPIFRAGAMSRIYRWLAARPKAR